MHACSVDEEMSGMEEKVERCMWLLQCVVRFLTNLFKELIACARVELLVCKVNHYTITIFLNYVSRVLSEYCIASHSWDQGSKVWPVSYLTACKLELDGLTVQNHANNYGGIGPGRARQVWWYHVMSDRKKANTQRAMLNPTSNLEALACNVLP